MIQRRKRNSSKVNLTISLVFHSVLILAVFFFAAREGMLGKKLKQITVTMVPKEKKPEPPKEKPPEPKAEPPKPAETPKPALAAAASPKVETSAPPPPSASEPAVAPPPASLPAFDFQDGAHEVQSVSDPKTVYKGLVEMALRSRWDRPEDLDDQQFVAEVDLAIDSSGRITGYDWRRGSGNTRWDNSVKAALAKTKAISRPPPKGFPEKMLVRFDVESSKTEPILSVSTR